MHFARSSITIPAQAKVQSQLRTYLPVVLHKPVVVMGGVVPIGICLTAGGWIDRGFLEIGIVAGKVCLRFIGNIGDCPVRLQRAVRSWSDRLAVCLEGDQFTKLILTRK